jgi:tRNA 2-selenouridine synthase
MKLSGKKIIVEDESATLGKIAIPRRFFHHMRQSPILVLEVPLEQRIRNIFESYVKGNSEEFFLSSLEKIKKSLGGVNYERIRGEMKEAFAKTAEVSHHEVWIRSLLVDYYDPMYMRDISRQGPLLLKRGTAEELISYFKSSLEPAKR